MATRWAIANGNWSSTSTWDGGTLPTSADDVHADGKTVTIDQDVTVLSLRTTARSGGTAGGGFTCSTTRTINCSAGSGIIAGSAHTLTFSGIAGTTLTINSVITGSSTTANINGLLVTGVGTVNVTGNLVGGNSAGGAAVGITSTGIFNVVGNLVSSGTNNGSGGISCSAAATINVTGNVQGNGANGTIGLFSSGNAVVTITGNVWGTGNAAAGVSHTGTSGSVTVTGTVSGGSATGSAGPGISVTGTATNITVTGTVTGATGGSSGAPGISNTGNGSTKLITVIGTVVGTTASSGIGNHGLSDGNTSGGWTVISGSTIDSVQGDSAVLARKVRYIPTLNTYIQHTSNTGYPNGNPVIYGSLDYIPNNMPTPANVRSGTVFANNEQTGTCAIPAAESVAYGVPVDNTTGTAAISAASIASLLSAQLAAALNP